MGHFESFLNFKKENHDDVFFVFFCKKKMAGDEEDFQVSDTTGYKVGEKKTLEELQKLDANDGTIVYFFLWTLSLLRRVASEVERIVRT
jgi:hypothetical protein